MMMKLSIILISALPFILAAELSDEVEQYVDEIQGVPQVTFCNDSLTDLIVNSYTLNPNNIQPNENVTFSVDAVLKEVVTDGTIAVKAKVGFIPVYDQTNDLCTELKEGNMSCPLNATTYHIKQEIQIPDIPIHGKVQATIKINDQDDNNLLCMEVVCQL